MTKSILIVVFALSGALAQAQMMVPSSGQLKQLEKQFAKAEKAQREAAYEWGKAAEMCRQTVLDNHWPETVQCNPQTLSFVERQPAAPAPQPQSSRMPLAMQQQEPPAVKK